MKEVIFQGQAREEIRQFPLAVKRLVGEQIMRLQTGLEPIDSKPVRTIGPGVREIRIRVGNQYRVIYTAVYYEAIYILSGFQKKSQKTPKHEIEKAKLRLKTLREHRRKL